MIASNSSPPSRDIIDRYATAVYPSMAMLAGMQLDVFTPLKDKPMGVEALAEILRVKPERLAPLLYALVDAELLSVDDSLFANTPVANHYLVGGRASYVGRVHEIYADLWAAGLKIGESIRTGTPQAEHDFTTMSNTELKTFYAGLNTGAVAAGCMLAETYEFSKHRHLLDVGGGSGGLAIAACRVCPDLKATVVDLERITPITRQYIAEAGLSGRIHVITADVLAGPPSGRFDVAVIRAFIQVLSPVQARRAIINVGHALEPGGQIIIVGRMLDDSRLSPKETVSFNLVFLSLYEGGQAFTESQYREWLAQGGFVDVVRHVRADEISIVTARRST